jgi:hypothetical protein
MKAFQVWSSVCDHHNCSLYERVRPAFHMNWERSHAVLHSASFNSRFECKTSKSLNLFPEVIQNFLNYKSYKPAFISSVAII